MYLTRTVSTVFAFTVLSLAISTASAGEKHDHDHDHDHEHEGEVHSDIEVAYRFECSAPGKLTQLTVELFESFSGMEKLKVQYVIEAKQGAAELTASKHVVKF